MKIKILELFGGIGSCTKAFKRLGIPHKVVDYVEIDKYAVKSYNAINDTNFEPQDITTWDKDIEIDLIMHGSPCQDFSLAGKQAGGDKDSGTRSSLMYETIRIVEKLKPKYVIWENVKNLLSKKHIHNFNAYLETMEQLGYTSYYQVLNAKDYGIPQNRERIFTISIRKDINKIFTFPQPQELKLKLKDMLENEVDEKYYLSEKNINYICGNAINKELKDVYDREKALFNKNIAYTISTKQDRRIGDSNFVIENYEDELTVKDYLTIRNNTKKGYLEARDGDGCYITNIDKKRGTVQKEMIPTLKTSPDIGVVVNKLRIRKLTPKECWRLMGFDDEDCDKAAQVNSNTQLYKQAGNSIVVNVLEAILTNLLLKTNQEISKGQMTIFDYEENI